MGFVYADITLVNAEDKIKAQIGVIDESEIRQTTLTAIVDTGVGRLAISEDIRQLLGLQVKSFRQAELADGTLKKYDLAGPVTVQWKNRAALCQAMVVPNASEVLLGVLPLEDMDLIVDPVSQELVGAHGDEILEKLK